MSNQEPANSRYITVREFMEYQKETTEWRIKLDRRLARVEFTNYIAIAMLIFTALAAVYAAMKA